MAPETTSGLWVWEALGEAGDLGPDGDRVTATESKPIRAEDEQKGRGYHRAGSVGLQTAPPFRSSVPGTSGAVRWSGRHASAAGGRRSGPGPGRKIHLPGGAAKNKQEAVLLHQASLSREAPPEKEMATGSSILAWKIPWAEEPGGLQSMGSQRVGHYRATNTFIFFSFRRGTEQSA